MKQMKQGNRNNTKAYTALIMAAILGLTGMNVNAAEDTPALTGTQQSLYDSETDPDEDIRDEILSDIDTETETLSITSAEDLVRLAHDCRLDTWSVNKHVTLDADISLNGVDFSGIPTFGGIFDGRGHTISYINLDMDRSYTGLFIYLQETAVVRNLHVTGRVSCGSGCIGTGGIAGSNSGIISNCSYNGMVFGADYVGGIAGFNELHGQIISSEATGYVGGDHFIGGIAGENIGNIDACVNNAYVNTSYEEASLSLKDVKLETYLNPSLLDFDEDEREQGTAPGSIYDLGGIAGLSIGVIMHSTNNGAVGYEQVGYNIGGIAGRQSGYILDCINNGEILGRKDAGGIVGQAEPYVTIDMSEDIAEQLTENISILHDLIDETLSDAGTSSDTISDRLSVIQQFTGQALNDTRFLADGTVSFANGVTGSVNEAFSRVEYILSESSKSDGAMDQVIYATDNASNAGMKVSDAVDNLDVYQYFSDEDKKTYDNSKEILDAANDEYSGYIKESDTAFRNWYIWKNASDSPADSGLKDLVYLTDEGDYTYNVSAVTLPGDKAKAAFTWSSTNYPENPVGDRQAFFDAFGKSGKWYHHNEKADGTYEDVSFPVKDSDETHTQYQNDIALRDESVAAAATDAADYADTRYKANHGNSYASDAASAAENMTAIILKYLPEMTEEVREDAQSAVSYLNSSVGNLKNAESETKRITADIAGRGAITFPELNSDYRAHTVSLADNLQGMNDNFGLLNAEMNGATDSLLGDLAGINDQFNKIMLLYSDAIDGVLDRDYSNTVEDDSFTVAETCTDATVANCINNGTVRSDIDTGGIAGTMAIEYDFDPESDVTGISDADLNTTYITKCVLRGNRNLADIEGNKSYVSGICALQEMGTILNCSSFADIKSGSGEYAGGIAGQSLSYIKGCHAKGDISAVGYAGGIAGDGDNILDCLTHVSITDAESWYGAIAGHVKDDGKVRNNFFVGDELSGIDRVSYSYKAEPVAFSDIFNLEGIDTPEDFGKCKVTFMLEDEDDTMVVERRFLDYREKLAYESYPVIEKREGYYIDWDKKGIDRVENDTRITAHFVKNITTLAGSELNEHGQSRVLVDGSFKLGDEIMVDKNITEAGEIFDNTLVIEGFTVVIPEDGLDTHTIRYALDDEYREDWEKIISVYEQTPDNEWKLLDDKRMMGKYLLFDAEGSAPHIQIRLNDFKKVIAKNVGMIILAVLGGILIFVFAIRLFIKRKNRIAKAARVIRQKTRDAAQNLGGQDIFYHAEEDRFGNEVVKEPETEKAEEDPDKDAETEAASDTEKEEEAVKDPEQEE